ncbi:hypothetical protein HDU90_006253 [Geranomyces variabilis]|nr:hypothetical protein HDU90_006253 [Geranomyces variabilis]
MQDSGLTHLMAGTTFAEHKDIARTLRRAITATPDNDLLDVQWEAVSAPTTTATTTTTTITTDAAVDEEEEVEEILGQWKADRRRAGGRLVIQWEAAPAATTTTITTNAAGEEEEVEEILGQWVAGWRSLRVAAIRLARKVEKHQILAGDIATLGDIMAAPAANWSAVTATAGHDLSVIQWEAAPTTTTTTSNDDKEVEEEVVSAQWKAGRRSLHVAAVHLARRVEKHQLAAGDIAALGAIIEAPAADWSAVLAEMASRIGEDAAKAMAASGTAPIEL